MSVVRPLRPYVEAVNRVVRRFGLRLEPMSDRVDNVGYRLVDESKPMKWFPPEAEIASDLCSVNDVIKAVGDLVERAIEFEVRPGKSAPDAAKKGARDATRKA